MSPMMLGGVAAQRPSVRYINPSTMAKPPGYTHVVGVNGPGSTIYIAGQTELKAADDVHEYTKAYFGRDTLRRRRRAADDEVPAMLDPKQPG
jgi:hypothetical protein